MLKKLAVFFVVFFTSAALFTGCPGTYEPIPRGGAGECSCEACSCDVCPCVSGRECSCLPRPDGWQHNVRVPDHITYLEGTALGYFWWQATAAGRPLLTDRVVTVTFSFVNGRMDGLEICTQFENTTTATGSEQRAEIAAAINAWETRVRQGGIRAIPGELPWDSANFAAPNPFHELWPDNYVDTFSGATVTVNALYLAAFRALEEFIEWCDNPYCDGTNCECPDCRCDENGDECDNPYCNCLDCECPDCDCAGLPGFVVPVTGLSLSGSNLIRVSDGVYTLSLITDESVILAAEVTPNNALIQTMLWDTSNQAIASIARLPAARSVVWAAPGTEIQVTANKSGTAEIGVIALGSAGYAVTATVTVRVRAPGECPNPLCECSPVCECDVCMCNICPNPLCECPPVCACEDPCRCAVVTGQSPGYLFARGGPAEFVVTVTFRFINGTFYSEGLEVDYRFESYLYDFVGPPISNWINRVRNNGIQGIPPLFPFDYFNVLSVPLHQWPGFVSESEPGPYVSAFSGATVSVNALTRAAGIAIDQLPPGFFGD